MFVKNTSNSDRTAGGKLIRPGEVREVPDGTALGKGLIDINNPPAAGSVAGSSAQKAYAKNAKDTIIDISEMEDVEALKAIIAVDDRTTVIKAAEARIKELEG